MPEEKPFKVFSRRISENGIEVGDYIYISGSSKEERQKVMANIVSVVGTPIIENCDCPCPCEGGHHHTMLEEQTIYALNARVEKMEKFIQKKFGANTEEL
jgi:hypothetical protein